MNVRILNYTGLSLKLKWESMERVIGCSSEQTIEILKGDGRMTRFYAEYQSISDVPANGQINLVFDSTKSDVIVILGGSIDNKPKYIGCMTINSAGKFLYTETDRSELVELFPTAKFFNISIAFKDCKGFWANIKKFYYATFNTSHCENRDSPMCDKIIGVPVLILIFILIILIIVAIIGTLIMGWKQKF